MKQSIEVNWEFLGAELASLTSDEQIAFFKGFTDELSHFPSHHAAETQCIFINNGLTHKQRDFMTTIGYKAWIYIFVKGEQQ